MQEIQATFATARVNRLIGQAFAAASILLSAESTLNFISQQPYLDKPVAWAVAGVLWSTTLLFAFSFWFGSARFIYLKIHALYMFFLVAAWPFILSNPVPTDGKFYPWIWWAVDTGWLAAALSFKLRWTVVYFFVLNLAMQVLFAMPVGGSHNAQRLITDFLFTLLTNGTAAVIALLLRNAAERTDAASAESIRSAILQARVEAQVKVRERLDALVHDRVLTALISASRATNTAEVKAATDLAASAIVKLAEVESSDDSGSVYINDLFQAIKTAGLNLDQQIKTSITQSSNWQLDKQTANAFTEATIQAVQNSILHAGGKAQRELILKSTDKDMKIVVKDDGRGFRPSRIPRGRLGLRVSVISRVESVGGEVHIASEPGKGATIILEWAKP